MPSALPNERRLDHGPAIRPKPSNAHKPRIRLYRDGHGFTTYEVSIGDGIVVCTYEFRAAWRWAVRVFQQANA